MIGLVPNFGVAWGEELRQAPYGAPVFLGNIGNQSISEASGLAPSILHKGVLWAMNDGGHKPYLFAISHQGGTIGYFNLSWSENIDWEDLGSFFLDGKAYLLVADVGDNDANRPFCTLYIVEEPPLSKLTSQIYFSRRPAIKIRFRYEDGPKDCEAVAVDERGRKILLLTKRTVPLILYELPFEFKKDNRIKTARKIAEVASIQPPTTTEFFFNYSQYRSQPTSMDIAPNGSAVAVLTYEHGYLFVRKPNEHWEITFSRQPLLINLAHAETGRLFQREALCFARDGKSIFITSEGNNAPLYQLHRLNED